MGISDAFVKHPDASGDCQGRSGDDAVGPSAGDLAPDDSTRDIRARRPIIRRAPHIARLSDDEGITSTSLAPLGAPRRRRVRKIGPPRASRP